MSSNFSQFQGRDQSKAICLAMLLLCLGVPCFAIATRVPKDTFARKVLAYTGDYDYKPDWALLGILLACSAGGVGVKLLISPYILMERLQSEQRRNEVAAAIASIEYEEEIKKRQIQELEEAGDYQGALALLKSGQVLPKPNQPNIAEVRKTESLPGGTENGLQLSAAPEAPALQPATKAKPVDVIPPGIDLEKKPLPTTKYEEDVWDDHRAETPRRVATIGDTELSGGLVSPADDRVIELVEGLKRGCPWVLKLLKIKLLAVVGQQGSGKNTFSDWFATLRMVLLGHDIEVIDPHSNKNTNRPKHFVVYGGANDWDEIGWRARKEFHFVESTSDATYDETADKYAKKKTTIWDEVSSYYDADKKRGNFDEASKIVPIAMTAVRKSDAFWMLTLHGTTSIQMGGVSGYSELVKKGMPMISLDNTTDEIGNLYPAGTGTLYNIPGIEDGTKVQILDFMRAFNLVRTFPELDSIRPKRETPEAIGAELTKKLGAHSVDLGDPDNPLTWRFEKLGDRRFLPSYSGVYALIDKADDSIHYVGESGNIMRRWVDHNRLEYAKRLQDPAIAAYPVDEDARKIVEGNLIGKYHPPVNGTTGDYGV